MMTKMLPWLLFIFLGGSVAIRNETSTTARSQRPFGETIKQLSNQLMEVNTSSHMTLDTRTPPRVKLHMKKVDRIENSHPGVAEPIDEESMKKLNFYKLEKPTTDSGLSTWILLSGQSTISPLTTKASINSTHSKQNISEIRNATILANPTRIIKPLFKKRPPTAITSKAPNILSTTVAPQRTTKLTKIKASLLSTSINNKNSSQLLDTKTKNNATNITKIIKNYASANTTKHNSHKTEPVSSSELVPELKDGDLDLSNTSTTQNPKKTRRPTNKKKKDKHRRRRPAVEEKTDSENVTKIANKVSEKDKPISTQIYNYLAREVMPTVGVGLVGLVVTAGLASYFLYPFGSLRRSYEIDRKDKDDSYYYDNDFNGGIAEEDAIGKVIAGMPTSSNYKSYRYQNSRHNYPYTRYRQVDQAHYVKPQPSIETANLNPIQDYNKVYELQPDPYLSKEDEPEIYDKNVVSQNVEATYTTNDEKFVVGNIPNEMLQDVTPAAVPEHGPRSLRTRKRRHLDQDLTNEVQVDDAPTKFHETINNFDLRKENNSANNEVSTAKPGPISTYEISDKIVSLIEMFRDLLNMKIRMGLEILQNKTIQFSRYVSQVQQRLNNSFKNNS